MKNTLIFSYSTNILVCLLTVNLKHCLASKNLKLCDPIQVTLLKMRPHYSQSSRENASLRSKRFRASSSRTSGREQKKKECSRSNFRAMTQLETLATQAMKMRPHLAAHPH